MEKYRTERSESDIFNSKNKCKFYDDPNYPKGHQSFVSVVDQWGIGGVDDADFSLEITLMKASWNYKTDPGYECSSRNIGFWIIDAHFMRTVNNDLFKGLDAMVELYKDYTDHNGDRIFNGNAPLVYKYFEPIRAEVEEAWKGFLLRTNTNV